MVRRLTHRKCSECFPMLRRGDSHLVRAISHLEHTVHPHSVRTSRLPTPNHTDVPYPVDISFISQMPQSETNLLKEHIVHHSPRCILVTFPDCIVCRKRCRELSLLCLFRLRGTALIKWPTNHACIFREVLRLASVWLYCCCGETSLRVKVPQRCCIFDSSQRVIDED